MERKSPGFMIYYEDMEALEPLTDGQVGQLFRILMGDKQPADKDVPQDLKLAYSFMSKKKKRDDERYASICEKRRQNIMQRWHTNEDECIQMNTNEDECIQMNTSEYTSIQPIPTATATTTTTATPSINKNKKEEDARAREALIDEVRERYIHGSSMLESKMNMLIRKYGVDAVRKELDARTIYELQWRLEHDEAAD